MATIEIRPLDTRDADPWPAVARAATGWLAARRVALRDAVVLVPYAALITPARAAFAAAGGWLPRVETPQTLAAALAPPPAPTAGAPSGDAVLDRLQAAAWLRRLPWAAARERDDPRGFSIIVGAFVQATLALRQAALAVAPAARAAHHARVLDACPPAGGPGAFEALLLRAAAEWASMPAAAASDALYDAPLGAWIVVRIAGRDALAEGVAAAAPAPALVLDLDHAGAGITPPHRVCCDGLEDEAAAAAAAVIDAVDAGRVPVALVALDRVLVRRVRALLERHAVAIDDETGWTLSTTRAAAVLMSLLRAAAPGAGADDRLDWLKNRPSTAPRALDLLESAWRRDREPPPAAQALWDDASAQLAPFGERRERSLADWIALLRDRLDADGTLAVLRDDAAGGQVLRALRVESGDAVWLDAASVMRLDLAGFSAWVDATLESAQFEPPAPPFADVVLTPLARVAGRPFAQVIVPGADAGNLGAVEPMPGLIADRWAVAVGLDGLEQRRDRQRLALAHALRAPAVTLLRRVQDGDEPLPPSPEVEALALARRQAGVPWPPETRWQPTTRTVEPAPVSRPQPAAPTRLPSKLSASTLEALRACPYRFFARAVLGLYEADELEAEVGKRDYGTWLHAVLHRFHRTWVDGRDDAMTLRAAADAETAALALDASELLPYRASFEHFVPAYLAWWQARRAQGWSWVDGEVAREVHPAELAPAHLEGRLDRVDRAPDGTLQVVDYKTGRADALKRKLRQPLEDTQLAVYALLEPGATSAIYLALDDPGAPVEVPHPGVQPAAHAMLGHLGVEFERLRAGAPMPALGEGAVCDTCEARGLCRRDHWGGA